MLLSIYLNACVNGILGLSTQFVSVKHHNEVSLLHF